MGFVTDNMPEHVDRISSCESVFEWQLDRQIRDLVDSFLANMWRVLLGHVTSLEKLIPQGCIHTRSLQF